MLLADKTNAGEHVLNIVGFQFDDLSLDLARLGARIVIEGLAMSTTNTKDALVGVNLVAEINIIDLIGVSLVHITSENKVKHVFWGEDAELVKNSQELALGDVTALSDIEVLELRLQMNAAVKNCCSIVLKIGLNLILLFLGALQVLTSGSESVLASDWLNGRLRFLINTLGGKSKVNNGAEFGIAEVSVHVVSLSKRCELSLSKREVKHGENGAELRHGDLALAELIEVTEELLNSYALHNHQSLKTLLNIIRIIGNVNCSLQVSILKNINVLGGSGVEIAGRLGSGA